MRFAVATVFALLFLPAVQAVTWDDPEGDQRVVFRPTEDGENDRELDNEMDWYPQFDIVSASVDETQDALVFTVIPRTTGPSGTEPALVNHVYQWIRFTFHGEERAIGGIWWFIDRTYPTGVAIGHWEDGVFVRDEGLRADPLDGAGWTIELPKWSLRDSTQVPVRAGDVLEDISVRLERSNPDLGPTSAQCSVEAGEEGVAYRESHCGVYPSDDLGTPESPAGDLVLQESTPGVTSLLLEAPVPLRVSNGAPTTYVFDVEARPLEEGVLSAVLDTQDVPDGWSVVHPETVPLGPQGPTSFQVAVTVPFNHAHGEQAGFNLTAREQDASAEEVAVTRLGVVWTDTPHPSGHHPTLRFHATPFGQPWMNTLTEDPMAEGTQATSQTRSTSVRDSPQDASEGLYHRLAWEIPLHPRLGMGLDGQPGEPVAADLHVGSPYTIDVEEGRAILEHRLAGNTTVLAMGPVAPTTIGSSDTTALGVEMVLTDAADRIPFHADANLWFRLVVNGTLDEAEYAASSAGLITFVSVGVDLGGEPYIDTSLSSLTLPLEEFHDELPPDLLDEEGVPVVNKNLEAPEPKDTSAPGVLFALLALAALVLRRR